MMYQSFQDRLQKLRMDFKSCKLYLKCQIIFRSLSFAVSLLHNMLITVLKSKAGTSAWRRLLNYAAWLCTDFFLAFICLYIHDLVCVSASVFVCE